MSDLTNATSCYVCCSSVYLYRCLHSLWIVHNDWSVLFARSIEKERKKSKKEQKRAKKKNEKKRIREQGKTEKIRKSEKREKENKRDFLCVDRDLMGSY